MTMRIRVNTLQPGEDDANQKATKFLKKIGQEVLIWLRGKSRSTKNVEWFPVVILESLGRSLDLTSMNHPNERGSLGFIRVFRIKN